MRAGDIFFRLINVRKSEASPFLHLITHAFFNGFGVSLALYSILYLLLKNDGVKALPLIYILAAIFLLIVGMVYSKLEHQMSPARIFSLALIFCFIWAGAVRFSLTLNYSLIPVAFAFASFYVVYLLTNLEFWGVAAIVFDVRQGKRLFAPVAVGESVAKIVGYSIPYTFAEYATLQDTFFLAALSFFVSWLILKRIAKNHARAFHVPHDHHSGDTEKIKYLDLSRLYKIVKKTGFTRIISLFALWGSLLLFILQYAFLERVQKRFPDEHEIAVFLALFLTVTKALNLLIKILISGRLLSFFGVKAGLLVLPVSLIIICLAGVVGDIVFHVELYFYIWVFAIAYFLDESLRTSLHQPAFLILFQPMAKNKRLEGHTLTKGIMEPLGMALAGIFLFGFQYLGHLTLQNMVIAVLILSIIWLFIARKTNKAYHLLLDSALKNRAFDRGRFSISKEEKELLEEEKLLSDDPLEVLYAMRLLKKQLSKAQIETGVSRLLKSKEEAILHEAFNWIEEYQLLSFQEELVEFVCDLNPKIVEKAAHTFTALKEEESVPILMKLVDEKQIHHKSAIYGGVLKHAGIYGAVRFGQEFLNLLSSENPDDRVLAAKIIGDISNDKYYHPLLILLQDKIEAVRKAAIYAAGNVRNKNLVPYLLDQLEKPSLFNACIAIIDEYGDIAVDGINQRYQESDRLSRIRLVKLSSRLQSEKGYKFLLELTKSIDHRIRSEAIYSLYLGKFKVTDEKEKKVVVQSLDKDLGALKTLVDLSTEKFNSTLLAKAIQNEIFWMILPQIMYSLSFTYDKITIDKILDNTLTHAGDYRSNALELLENVLKRKDSKYFLPLIEKAFEVKLDIDHEHASMSKTEEIINIILNIDEGIVSDWLIGVSVRVARKFSLNLSLTYDELTKERNGLVKEESDLYFNIPSEQVEEV